ncbi:flavodoxin/nitric oxide synthase [Clostridium sp. DL-VIII]|uniref:flavodoxin n=1 Tax=Clostridium sp. DL-VIII TaxID=641107 RepID=UPI00023B0043|nr:flavodoxin [Clostridium sp. DL-VIII]EHI99171.1 flavodoxin/nitric oxide synthase [Clostridium sp. DL-VIII]
MKNKKIIIMGLICAFLMGVLAGCGSNINANQAEKSQKEEINDDSNKESTEIEGKSGKVLVVYYSATGNTEAVAKTIAETMKADTFELKPVKPYSDDDLNWSNNNSRVTKEHDNPDSRNVQLTATTVDNWKSYDTVLIGYPIWWGIAAWPVDGFVKANDFTGKTVIPFCTSVSSDIGDSGNLLAKMAGTGNWLEGERFRSSASKKDVQTWIESLRK